MIKKHLRSNHYSAYNVAQNQFQEMLALQNYICTVILISKRVNNVILKFTIIVAVCYHKK